MDGRSGRAAVASSNDVFDVAAREAQFGQGAIARVGKLPTELRTGLLAADETRDALCDVKTNGHGDQAFLLDALLFVLRPQDEPDVGLTLALMLHRSIARDICLKS